MISVPSRLQRLSGSNRFWPLLALLWLVACSTPRQAGRQPPKPKPVERPEMIRVYDPVTDSYILKPANEAVDTVRWTVDPRPPLLEDKEVEAPVVPGPGVLSDLKPAGALLDIAIALPLMSDPISDRPDPRQLRFMQFYSGMRLALDEAGTSQSALRIRVVETGEPASLTAKLTQPDGRFPDLIIGPYEREGIENLLATGDHTPAIVISPWLPAFTPPEPHPNLIQLTPGLTRHAETIMAYIDAHMTGQQVVLVGRDMPMEKNRMALFQEHARQPVKELIVRDKSATLEGLDLTEYFSDEGTVFVMPYYSRTDEVFVNAFLRKLHADRGTFPVTVFGLPQWAGFQNLNTHYLESLSLHLTAPAHPGADPETLKSFRERFYVRYHAVPDINAMQGYDLATWLMRTARKYGMTGLVSPQGKWTSGLASGFDIQPVWADDTVGKTLLYHENANLRIVRYVDQDFQLVD